MSFFEYTSFEPGRHQRSEVAILQTHFSAAYAHIRSHGIESTRMFDYGRGHRHRQTLEKEPSRGQPCTRAAYTQRHHLQLLASSFAFRTPYRTQGPSFLIDYKDSAPTSKFSTHARWESPRPARGLSQASLGKILTANRGLKGMHLSYSQSFR